MVVYTNSGEAWRSDTAHFRVAMLVKKHVLGLQVAVSYAMLVAVFDRACTIARHMPWSILSPVAFVCRALDRACVQRVSAAAAADGSRTDDRSKDLLRLVLGHAPVRLLADEIRELAAAGKPAAATKQACVANR